MKCATATALQSTSALPTAWSLPNQNFQPFRDVDEPINSFCNNIANRNATLWAGKLDKPGTTLGECNQFSSQNNSMVPITQIGHHLSIGLTYVNGCVSVTEYDLGVPMANYTAAQCEKFFKFIVSSCTLPGAYTEKAGLGDYKHIGGRLWRDCMQWTIVAADPAHSAPETYGINDGANPSQGNLNARDALRRLASTLLGWH
ncbi:hypothetical protein PV04_00775 [Phialophora macrospora]|uniref:Uncharacterized protein n=1 Tax=Phialophora macrospora TaxID=1851006 RepID=A0A0D2GJP1_9EURO|nr:hypothetical protein PV04_00775 [Phialophora macrospora]